MNAINRAAAGGIGDTSGPDPMERAEDVPDISVLQQELQYAWNQDQDLYNLTSWKEDIRYNRWEGQHPDGLKHSTKNHPAKPYDRASDTRIMLVDGIINGLVDVLYAAFWESKVDTSPTTARTLNAAQAAELRAIINWMKNGPLRRALTDDVEFAANLMLTIGWCVLHPVWRSQMVMRMTTLTLADIQKFAAAQTPGSPLSQAVALILDPAQEKAAVDLMRLSYPDLTAVEARQAVKELRESEEHETQFAVAEPGANVPELAVLVPGQHFVLPPEGTALADNGRWMPRRMFFSEQALRQRAAEEEWNNDFVERAVKTKGQAISNQTMEHDVDQNLKNIEIFYMFQRRNNDDGVPGLWCTIFSMFVQPDGGKETQPKDYGKHWLVNAAFAEYPFIFLQTEVTGLRPMDSRGMPEILQTQQHELKNSRDAVFMYEQLSVTPPLQKKGTQASKLPPELGPMGIVNNPTGGEWSWFPPPAGNPELPIKLGELVRKEAEDYAGIPRGDTLAQRWQARLKRLTTRFLSKMGEALWQLAVLAYQNLSKEELKEILGRKPLLDADLVARHQVLLSFDVRTMDNDFVQTIIKAISESVLPADTGGTMDRNKWISLILAYLYPGMSEELTSDTAGASQALYKEVRDEVGSIMAGNEAIYKQNDPTAKAKLKFLDQVLANNKEYQAQLTQGSPQFNPTKRERLEKYQKNLQQSAVQMVDNKVIGRLGVKPGEG